MNEKPIGIFDSGLGGLTVVKEILKIIPNENIIYFGDTGRVPYGTKSCELITKYANQNINFLKFMNVKAIIAACGTVSSIFKNPENLINLPYIDILKPTCVKAVNETKNKKIAVIGTTATINSHSYENQIKSLSKNISVFQIDCPLFVPLIENGITDKNNKILKETIKFYLKSLKNSEIDTLVLGCTHYPIICEAICDIIGNNINIINSGQETAKFAAEKLKELNMLNTSKNIGYRNFFVSDAIENFSLFASKYLQFDNINTKKIDIENY